MNFFKKLFKQNSTDTDSDIENNGESEPTEKETSHAEAATGDAGSFKKAINDKFSFDDSGENFETELYDSLRRYYSTPDLEFDLNLTDKDGTKYKPHEAFNAVFDEWQKIRSKWDRRSLLFRFWDESDFKKLANWQIIERYNNDRFALKSFKFRKDHLQSDNMSDVRLVIALAKTYRLLSQPIPARQFIEFAFANLPDHPKVKAEYANILHLSDAEADKELAHKLINDLIKDKISASEATTIGLLNYFCFSKDYIDSSIFAALFLNAENGQLSDWDIMAEEYYYCPVFRHEHAVKLANSGEALLALAKFNSLSEEFPWYKAGLSSTVSIIKQFRVNMNNPNFMSEEMEKLNYYQSLN